MSRFSGKCDFYDLVFGTADTSKNEFEIFEEFKKQTGGVIYQLFKPEISKKWELQRIAETCPNDLKIYKNENGKTVYETKYMIYKTFKSAIKHILVHREIHFETILDLVEYFPYLVTQISYEIDKKYFEISSRPYTEIEAEHAKVYGYIPCLYEIYKKNLQEEYYKLSKLLDKKLGFESEGEARLWYELNYGSK